MTSTTNPQQFSLIVTEKGDRLDRWLSAHLTDLSRSRIQKLIEGGQVCLNDEVCTAKKRKVNPGDCLVLSLPPLQPLDVEPEAIPLDILYEDEALILVNKPPGMVVHPAPGHHRGTLVNGLLFHCKNLAGIGGVERPGIVHRLDKDTTGVLVVAKTDFVHQHLQKQIQTKTAQREYWGIVYGVTKTNEGQFDFPIGRHPVDRKKMAIVPLEKGGRASVTHWKILERLRNYTLMQFNLETGRTHQIRVHSSHQGHPLVGDQVYGSGRSVGVNLPGQALHARRLQLQHPLSGKSLEAIAPLPAHFTTLLDILRNR